MYQVVDAEKRFFDLPFRVAIEILKYHLITISESTDIKDLFGIFKNDRTRHVFFLFSGLEFKKNTNLRDHIINCERIEYLSLSEIENLELFMKHSHLFIRLVHLWIEHLHLDEHCPFDPSILIGEVVFPRLKSLTLSSLFFHHFKFEKWNEECNDFFSRLEMFSLLVTPENIGHYGSWNNSNIAQKEICFLTNPKNFLNLKSFSITNAQFPSTTTITLPKVENLVVERCKFLKIENEGKTLRSIKAVGVDEKSDFLKEGLLLGQTNLKILDMKSFLKMKSLDGKFGWKEMPKLKVLKLYSMYSFDDDIFINHELRLEELRITSVSKVLGKGWNLKSLSHSLRVFCCHSHYVHDEMFRTTTFHSLEELYLDPGFRMDGKNWKKIPKLKILRYYGRTNSLTDSFFRDNDFETVEELSLTLDYHSKIKGRDWRFLPNLKKLRIWIELCRSSQKIEYFPDEFWKNKPFPDCEGTRKENAFEIEWEDDSDFY